MKRIMLVLFSVILLFAFMSSVSILEARGRFGGHGHHFGFHGGHSGFHSRIVFGFGAGFWPGYYWGYYPYYWGPPVVGWPYHPPVVTEGPPVDSEAAEQQPYYWYYCENPQGYYPYLKSCPGGWIPVVPQVPPSNP
jgi:hypothetical protein